MLKMLQIRFFLNFLIQLLCKYSAVYKSDEGLPNIKNNFCFCLRAGRNSGRATIFYIFLEIHLSKIQFEIIQFWKIKFEIIQFSKKANPIKKIVFEKINVHSLIQTKPLLMASLQFWKNQILR